ncbi:MAG: sugar ABC transporter permease [Spirochaetaceae bacterium]|nr:MAG: sugar ABC transporter permease [Spirochaetaceae bacterium]
MTLTTKLWEKIGFNQKLAPYLFVSPFFILFLIFGLYPIGYSFYMSLFDMRLVGNRGFVGLANYTRLFTIDEFFGTAVVNTLILLVTGSLLQHVFAIPMAIIVNNPRVRARHTFKALFFAPFITSTVATVIIFGMVFDHNYGLLNWIIENVMGMDGLRWTGRSGAIKATISILLNWRFIGFNMVIYLAGLQGIPKELYEAAAIDGAGTLQQHRLITLPLLLPIIFFGVSLSLIGGFQLFDEPFVLLGGYDTVGGPGQGGLTIAYYLMILGFKNGRLGRGAAIAWVLFFIILLATTANRIVTNRLQKK